LAGIVLMCAKVTQQKNVKSLKNVNFKIYLKNDGVFTIFFALLLTLENRGVFTIFFAFLLTLENRGVLP
jgi:succinate-acetate transporter protein